MSLRKQFQQQEKLFGAWTSLAHPQIAEMFATLLKPDFIGIDIEHSTISLAEAQRIIAAGQSSGVPVLPRIASHNGEAIKRLADSGADGFIVPMVDTREQLDQIIRWIKYSPAGSRSFGIARAQGYGADFGPYTKGWNEKSVLIIQIESVTGVKNVEALLDSEYVDGVMIGPYDISGSLGIPGELEHKDVLKACDTVIEACYKFKKSIGTQDPDPTEKTIPNYLSRGYNFLVLSSDIFLMWRWCERMRETVKGFR